MPKLKVLSGLEVLNIFMKFGFESISQKAAILKSEDFMMKESKP